MKIKLQSDYLNYLGSFPGPYQRGNKAAGIREQAMNSYEADASTVKITFKGFGRGYRVQKESSIIIEDDGHGITLDMFEYWFEYPKGTKIRGMAKVWTAKGRKPKGGGGKGRVGTFLLGSRGRITSSPKGEAKTYILDYDFTKSEATLTEQAGEMATHGTKIEVFDLHGYWSQWKILGLCDKLVRLYRRISLVEGADCEVSLWKDEVRKFSILYRLRSRGAIWGIIIWRLFSLDSSYPITR